MTTSDYIDILRNDIHIHRLDENKKIRSSAVALYTQWVHDALRLPAWVKSVGQVYILASIRDLLAIIHRVPIPTSTSVQFHYSTTCETLIPICPPVFSSLQVQRMTMTWTGDSRKSSESHSATVLQSEMFSI